VIADGAYRGEFIDKVKSSLEWILKVVLRKDSTSKFQILPKRWIVERTLVWFDNYRRLGIDYEFNEDTTEVMIHLAMIKLYSFAKEVTQMQFTIY
ncbi:MAG: hypothetical protein LBJ63_07435, partial [Prevotellaceae bacterium]|nr:hypothetical protein [Prevotellaceae bacterium]